MGKQAPSHLLPEPRRNARVAGIDLSLRATGVAMANALPVVLRCPDKVRGLERIEWWCSRLLPALRGSDTEVVVWEGYSMGARQHHRLCDVAELKGVLLYALRDRLHVNVPPAVLKKYATGKGNADKDEMVAAAANTLGLAAELDHNAADAAWLRTMGLHAYGAVGQAHEGMLETVQRIDWPAL